MERIAGLIERFHASIFALALVTTAAALVAMLSLRIEHAQEKYSPPDDDPVVRSMEQFRALFGARTVLVAALDFGRPIRTSDIAVIQDVEGELRSLSGVAAVFGLPDVQQVVWDLFQPRAIPVIGTGSTTDADFARLRRLVEGTPVYRSGLVSSDWCVAGLTIELQRLDGPGGEARTTRLALQVENVLRVASGNRYEPYLTGTPLLNQAFQNSARSDVRTFGVVSVVFVTALLLALFRRWRPVALAALTAAVSLVWTLGLLAATNTPMSASLAMVVPLIPVISVAFSVHYLAHFYGGGDDGDGTCRFGEMMGVVFPPSVLTGLTTAAGFLALATSRLESVRETGVFISAGVCLSMTASSVLLPALLCTRVAACRSRGPALVLSSLTAGKVAVFVSRRARLIVGIVVVLSAVAVLGATRITFDANPLHYFPSNTPLRRSSEFIDSTLGGSLSLEILVARPRDELQGLVPAVLQVERELRSLPEFGFVGSAGDFLEMAEAARPGTTPQLYDLASGRFPTALWSGLAANQTLGRYVVLDSTNLVLRITSRVRIADSETLRRLTERVQRVLENASLEAETSVTGLVPLLLRTQQYMVNSQVSSILLAFLLVLLLLFPFVRSRRVGLLAIVVNVVPLIVISGVLGWLEIPIDISSVMIASVALGIIVDDTIHFLYRFRACISGGLGVDAAIERTYEVVGVPLVITTIVLVGGFATLIPSAFRPTSVFGLLSAIAITSASIADLLLLPAMLVIFQRGSSGPVRADGKP